MAFAVIFTIVLAIAIRYFAKRERNKRLIRLPKIKGIARSRRRMELANRRRGHN
jgi:type II secretory pathway component PulF